MVLARGLGTRMRAADSAVDLTPEQHRAADAGLKAMLPVRGRPFMDYILSGLADAGLTEIAIVVAPEHEALHHYYVSEAPPSRIALSFVVQKDPLGTADAVLAAERWTSGADFLVMNGDNLYPARGIADLIGIDEPGLLAFDPEDLIRSGNIPADRIKRFALIERDERGYLTHIVEKPAADRPRDSGREKPQSLVSMNCWRFDARIFDACREVPRSSRGELELPEAVELAVRRGVPFKVLNARGPVLDLSRRADAAAVERLLHGVVPRP